MRTLLTFDKDGNVLPSIDLDALISEFTAVSGEDLGTTTNACDAHYNSHSALTSRKKREGESSAVATRNESKAKCNTAASAKENQARDYIDNKFNWFTGQIADLKTKPPPSSPPPRGRGAGRSPSSPSPSTPPRGRGGGMPSSSPRPSPSPSNPNPNPKSNCEWASSRTCLTSLSVGCIREGIQSACDDYARCCVTPEGGGMSSSPPRPSPSPSNPNPNPKSNCEWASSRTCLTSLSVGCIREGIQSACDDYARCCVTPEGGGMSSSPPRPSPSPSNPKSNCEWASRGRCQTSYSVGCIGEGIQSACDDFARCCLTPQEEREMRGRGDLPGRRLVSR